MVLAGDVSAVSSKEVLHPQSLSPTRAALCTAPLAGLHTWIGEREAAAAVANFSDALHALDGQAPAMMKRSQWARSAAGSSSLLPGVW